MRKYLDWTGALLQLQKMVHDYGPKEVADELNISVNSLYKQIDPNYNIEINPPDHDSHDSGPRYKLGFQTFIKICLVIDDFSPVIMLLNGANYSVFKTPEGDSNCLIMTLLSRAMNESNDVVQVTIESLQDKIISKSEAKEGMLECDDAINAWSALRGLYASVLDRRD